MTNPIPQVIELPGLRIVPVGAEPAPQLPYASQDRVPDPLEPLEALVANFLEIPTDRLSIEAGAVLVDGSAAWFAVRDYPGAADVHRYAVIDFQERRIPRPLRIVQHGIREIAAAQYAAAIDGRQLPTAEEAS